MWKDTPVGVSHVTVYFTSQIILLTNNMPYLGMQKHDTSLMYTSDLYSLSLYKEEKTLKWHWCSVYMFCKTGRVERNVTCFIEGICTSNPCIAKRLVIPFDKWEALLHMSRYFIQKILKTFHNYRIIFCHSSIGCSTSTICLFSAVTCPVGFVKLETGC